MRQTYRKLDNQGNVLIVFRGLEGLRQHARRARVQEVRLEPREGGRGDLELVLADGGRYEVALGRWGEVLRLVLQDFGGIDCYVSDVYVGAVGGDNPRLGKGGGR